MRRWTWSAWLTLTVATFGTEQRRYNPVGTTPLELVPRLAGRLTQHFERLLIMISKFDVTIQSDELTAADLYNAQAEWEAEQYEVEMAEIAQAQWEAFQADHEPIMDLPNDLYMVFDDPDYWG
jgi:hypothetical protein